MTFTIIWEPVAVDLAARYLSDDPDGLRTLFDAVDALAQEPRPARTFRFGFAGRHRLRVGRYRVVYDVDDAGATVKVRHVGRRS